MIEMASTKEQAQLSCSAELQCIIITQHLGGVVDGIEFSCNGMLALPPSTNDCQLASSAGSSADLLAVTLEEGLDVGNKSQAFSVESGNSFGVQSPAISVGTGHRRTLKLTWRHHDPTCTQCEWLVRR